MVGKLIHAFDKRPHTVAEHFARINITRTVLQYLGQCVLDIKQPHSVFRSPFILLCYRPPP